MAEFNRTFFERGQDFVTLWNEQDANTDITGDWIKLRDYSRALVVMEKFGTEDVDDLGLQFLQATDAAGSGSKALSIPSNGRYFTKTGTLTSATVWTAGTLTALTDGLGFGSALPTGFVRVIADVNTAALLLAVDIESAWLDIDGGFDWFTGFIEGDNVNNACLISAFVILLGGRFPQAVPLSAIS